MKSIVTVLIKLMAGAVIAAVAMGIIGTVVINAVLLPRLDEMLANAMRRELSLPGEATVRIERGSLRETVRGFLPRSRIESPSAVIDDLPVEMLSFRTEDIDFNMQRILKGEKAEITHVGTAELSLRITADELRNRLIPAIEKLGMTNVRVEFADGSVTVTAENDAEARLSATGRFHLTSDNRVGFSLTGVELDLIDITVSDLSLPVEDILPDLDLGGMFARIAIDEVNLTSTYLEIAAHAEEIDSGQVPEETIDVF